jgi:hypothetical protein
MEGEGVQARPPHAVHGIGTEDADMGLLGLI